MVIGKIIKKASKYTLLYVSSLVPKKDNLLIFGSWLGEKYADNPRYLFEYVVNHRKDLKAVWITSNKSVFQELTNLGYPVLLSDSKEAHRTAMRAKYVFTATGKLDIGERNSHLIGSARYINLWHGIPLKKIMYDDEYTYAHHRPNFLANLLESFPFRHYYVVSTSETFSKIYESAFLVNKKQVLELGQPRNDYFFDSSYPKSDLLATFNGKRIISYMPTHRNEGKKPIDLNSLFDLEKLNAWCEKNHTVFVIKKHFYHRNDPALSASYPAIVDLTRQPIDAQELMKYSDVLITDYSSCYIDYMLLDRPIVFFNYDYDEYIKEDRKMYFPYEEVTPGAKCTNFAELLEQLNDWAVGQDAFCQEREKVKGLFYSENNQHMVSEQVLEAVLKL